MSQLNISFDAPEAPLVFKRADDAFGHVLSPEQARVRDAGLGHMVVVAGAGTGKTELLTQRVLKLLLDGGGEGQTPPAELEGIVALTFTNKAAAEMRTRVYRALVRRLRLTTDASERARLRALRARFGEDNRIWTFDSLGSRLLQMFPEHSPLPRGSRLPTAGEERTLNRELGRMFWAWAETFDEGEAEELFSFLDIFERRETALALIRDTAKRSRAELEFLAREEDFAAYSERLLDAIELRLARLWDAHVAQVEAMSDLSPVQLEKLLDAEKALLPVKSGGFLTQSGLSAPFARELPSSLSESDKTKLTKRLLEWRDGHEDAQKRRETLSESDPTWEREWRSRQAVAALSRYALWWQKEERAWKDDKSLADFSDVTRAALELVETPEVARALRSQIDWLLVDEFQDTNPDQWQLVQGLRRQVQSSASTSIEGNTLVVGDPKQAIYDFRGGDLAVFEAGRRALEREGAQKVQLSVSRRSAPALVSWTNRAFESIFPPEEGVRELFEAPHGPLNAVPEAWAQERAPADSPDVYILRPPAWRSPNFESAPKPNIEALRQEAANALAKWLLELLDDARQWKRFEASPVEPLELKQPGFSSISRHIANEEPAVAILFTDNTVKGLYEEVLRGYDVPFVSLRGRGFFTSDAVRWSVLLWRALLDGDDEAAWAGVLRSPLGGQSDVALLERFVARKENPDGDFSPSDAYDAAMWNTVKERLAQWRALAGVAPVSLVMERVLEEAEIAFYEAPLFDAPVRRENWRKVLDMVRQREAEGEGSLRALVDYFEAHVGDDRESLAPLPAGASIQLMTVHASKGLGFPLCVLAQLESPKRDGGDKTLLRGELNGEPLAAFSFSREREEEMVGTKKPSAPLAYELLKRAAFERSLAEWKRLFYVACTRAASHLVLLETDRNAPVNSWGALVRPSLGGLSEITPSETEMTSTPRMESRAGISQQSAQQEQPSPFVANTTREVRFDQVFGLPNSSLGVAQKRAWLELLLRERGQNGEGIRQDLPFGARGSLFERDEEWIVGAWEWLAPLADDALLLVATGETQLVARTRAEAMRRVATESGFLIGECFAVWSDEEEHIQGASV